MDIIIIISAPFEFFEFNDVLTMDAIISLAYGSVSLTMGAIIQFLDVLFSHFEFVLIGSIVKRTLIIIILFWFWFLNVIILLFHWRINHHDHQVTLESPKTSLIISLTNKSPRLSGLILEHYYIIISLTNKSPRSSGDTQVTKDVTASSLYIKSRDHFFSNIIILIKSR